MSDLIKALQIFLKYSDGTGWPTNCSHDCFAVVDSPAPEDMDPDDLPDLEALGFLWSDEHDCWISFRFGSC